MTVPLAVLSLGPLQFDEPIWLLLIPVLWALTLYLSRRSIAGLDRASRIAAIVIRLLLIVLIVGAIAEPHSRKVSHAVAVTAVVDESRSIPPGRRLAVDQYLEDAGKKRQSADDLLGVVTAAEDAYVQALPSSRVEGMVRQYVGATDGTNLGEATRLALAVANEDAANRLVLISDGNETDGSILAAAEAAKALGVPIDVLPINYDYEHEVIVESLIAPATARGGETINLKVVVFAAAPAAGRLVITENGEPIDLDPDSDEMGVVVELVEGRNVLTVPIAPRRVGPQTYEAVFEPLGAITLGDQGQRVIAGVGDSMIENNRAMAVTFVGSEGAVLVVAEDAAESEPLTRALAEAELRPETIASDRFPPTLTELNRYEAIILVDEPAYNFSAANLENLRQYVHDSGGGLVMTGGPDSFGAGGWIGTAIEDALPVRLDPPQKRQMPRGALALVIHSIEMPQGVYYGKQVANAAADALSRLDLIGIIEFQMWGGTDWVHQLQPKGDGVSVKQSINKLEFGDMPSFDESLQLALSGLSAASAGQKHVIVISDGDPSLTHSILDDYNDAGISISTVGVFPHSTADFNSLKSMADDTGGTFYAVNTNAALATLPQIFIKEAQTVKRSLIWEGEPFSPTVMNVGSETMRGITGVPPISGYVVTADREGLSQVTLRGHENDPIAAEWQFGLGKVFAFTSDATSRWGAAWTGWDAFKQFWEQHVRWAMRPSGSANLRLTTEARGDSTLLVVEAFDADGARLNFADFQARVAKPDGKGAAVDIQQVGPGRYEGVIDSSDPGSYVVSLRFRAPGADGGVLEGAAQAAVTRPFADEFRALESNIALLRQVAQVTGGQVLTGDATQDKLWRRDGLDMPVSTTSIWLTVALIAVGLFLTDVGVRRVRVEPRAVLAWFARAMGASRSTAGEQIDSLRQAREKARKRMETEGEGKKDADRAKRRFEVDASAPPPPQGPTVLGGEPIKSDRPKAPPKPKAAAGEEEEGGISRLMRAKRRAQEEYEKDKDQGPKDQ
ncbi:MAG: VWA domain-containing protein [Phycisphaerales bacterium]